MGMLDFQERFGTDQPVLGVVLNSTNTYDTRNTVDRTARTMTVEFIVTADFATGTSLTLEVMEDAASDRGTETVAASLEVAVADLVEGAVFHVRLPRKTKRYLGVQFSPTGTFDAGTISSYMIENPQTNGAEATTEFYENDNSGR